MYSGAWKDSTERDGDGLLVWRLDDLFDPDAFIIVTNIIHGFNRMVPRHVDLELLAKIAVVTDYLQCHESTEVFYEVWTSKLRHSIPRTYCRELILWIMVSSIFHDQEAFRSATRTAVLQSDQKLPSVGLPIYMGIIG